MSLDIQVNPGEHQILHNVLPQTQRGIVIWFFRKGVFTLCKKY